MNRFFIAVVALFASLVSYGQDVQKIGYADTDYIILQHPDAKKMEAELKTYGGQLEAQLKSKYTEYEKKMQDFQQNAAKWVDAVVQDKQRELEMLQQQFQKFQQDAEASFTKKQQELLAPLHEKIGNAIADVAKENGYAFILTLNAAGNGGMILLHKDPQYDISNLVLKKLGVTPTAAAPATKPQPK